MMEVLSYDLDVSKIIPFESIDFRREATYIWVWHVDKIPPHIGISTDGNYFSLKANGKDENVDVAKVIDLVERKKIKTLLFELNIDPKIENIQNAFEKYSTTSTNNTTCLNPLKRILNITNALILKELLAELNSNGQISNIIGVNIDASFEGIQDYKIEDIHDRLRKLEND